MPPSPPDAPPRALAVPANRVAASDHTTTRPPSPCAVALACSTAPPATATMSAWRTAASLPWKPPPTRTLPPPVAPEASSCAWLPSRMRVPCTTSAPPWPCSDVASTWPSMCVSAPASSVTRPAAAPAACADACVLLLALSVSVSLARSSTSPVALSPSVLACTRPDWLTMDPCTSTLPPSATSRPRFNTSPAGTSTRTVRLGRPVSTRSTLRAAARPTLPPGALMLPLLCTCSPSSRIWPPKLLCSAPSLRTQAVLPASAVKR